jgi:hypothetical protein
MNGTHNSQVWTGIVVDGIAEEKCTGRRAQHWRELDRWTEMEADRLAEPERLEGRQLEGESPGVQRIRVSVSLAGNSSRERLLRLLRRWLKIQLPEW